MPSAGSFTTNGDCTGTQFSDPYETWNNVVVQAIFKIRLQEHQATIHLNWNTLPNDVCNLKKYEVIYEGPANKIYGNTTDNSETLYSLSTEDITFLLTENTRKPVCLYVLIQIDHSKLLIFAPRPGNSFLENNHLAVQSKDILKFINFKFIYVKRYICTEVN